MTAQLEMLFKKEGGNGNAGFASVSGLMKIYLGVRTIRDSAHCMLST